MVHVGLPYIFILSLATKLDNLACIFKKESDLHVDSFIFWSSCWVFFHVGHSAYNGSKQRNQTEDSNFFPWKWPIFSSSSQISCICSMALLLHGKDASILQLRTCIYMYIGWWWRCWRNYHIQPFKCQILVYRVYPELI